MKCFYHNDPVGVLKEGAISIHELYLSYVEVGFTKAQAMQLMCAMISAVTTNSLGTGEKR